MVFLCIYSIILLFLLLALLYPNHPSTYQPVPTDLTIPSPHPHSSLVIERYFYNRKLTQIPLLSITVIVCIHMHITVV